jgi:ribosome-associated heat shock protein Hsp15
MFPCVARPYGTTRRFRSGPYASSVSMSLVCSATTPVGLSSPPVMRVDKWLWTSRLLRTRRLAAAAVKGGRVHINGVAVKPSREVKVGDQLQLTLGHERRTVIVRGAAERRVSPAEATTLYSETEESVAERERRHELGRLGGRVEPGGRPTKRDRRRFDAGRR